MNRENVILTELKGGGYRLTQARKAIIQVLCEARAPLGAPDIIVLMASIGTSVNKTTVYRELEFLKGQGLVAEVLVGDGLRRYELMPEGHHHHHLVCNECSAVECVEVESCVGEDVRQIDHIEKTSDFKVTDHSLKFFGLCARCRL
ncbi:MAG: transcriptional repressor [Thermodesulfovibrionales bacterium]|nr:transcriptional repressor [Thermodesulfovibrionales bacterium]